MVKKVKKKNSKSLQPLWHALLSGFVAPGLGQILNRDYFKGIFLLVCALTSFSTFSHMLMNQLSLRLPGTPEQWQGNQATLREAIFALVREQPNPFITFHLLMITIWTFGVIDAYIGAKKKLRYDMAKLDNTSDRESNS